MNVLVIVAHPDDEILGCGGTMAKLAAAGHDVYIAILGEGATSRYDTRQEADPNLVVNLRANSREAGKIVGARDVMTYELPDNRFDSVNLLDIVKIIEDLVNRVSPQVVYTHHSGDLNIDHGIVNRAVLTATRPTEGHAVREVYTFSIASSTEWAFHTFAPFHPNVFVDVGETLNLKIRAMETYASEARPFPHPRSPEALMALARLWGSAVGFSAAEAFHAVRIIR